MPPSAPALKRRHIAAASLGNALAFYDFLIYAFFALQIGHALFPAASGYVQLMLSLGTFASGFLMRPVGALVLGGYADRAGRKPAMLLCFALMGGAILGMALVPSYRAIGLAAPILAVLMRMVQGFALGGEVGAVTAYLVEAATPAERGLVVASQRATQLLALTIGPLVGLLLTQFLSSAALSAYGWRIAFLLGAVTLPFGWWLRRGLPEVARAPPAIAPPATWRTARTHWRILALGFAIYGGATIGAYGNLYLATYAQNTLHLHASVGFAGAALANVLAIAVVFAGGALSDRFGRRRLNVYATLPYLFAILPCFMWMSAARSTVALIGGSILLGVLGNLTEGSMTVAVAESLPPAIRGQGFAMVYALGIAIFGGSCQLVMTWLIHITGNPLAPAWYMAGAAAITIAAAALLAESAPSQLS